MTNQTINASSIQHQREEQDDEMKKKERDWDSEGIKSSSFKGTSSPSNGSSSRWWFVRQTMVGLKSLLDVRGIHTERHDGLKNSYQENFKTVLFGTKLNALLLFAPLGIVCHTFDFGDGPAFAFALLALCPLAERLGYVTEEMAKHTSQTIGGLLNATFGNATEMIVSVFALRDGLLRVVQLSLVGSIFSNMLLVLGCAFFAGGVKWPEQRFNKNGAMTNSSLLCLAVMGVTLPNALHATHTELHGTASELALSRFSATLLLIMYVVFLYFQLVSHTDFFEDEPASTENNGETKDDSFISNTSKKKKGRRRKRSQRNRRRKRRRRFRRRRRRRSGTRFHRGHLLHGCNHPLHLHSLRRYCRHHRRCRPVLELPGGVHFRRHVTDCRQRRRTRLGGHVRFTQQNGHLHRRRHRLEHPNRHVRLPVLRLRRVGDGQTSRFEHESLRNRLVGFVRRHRDVLHTRRERKLVERFDLDFSVRDFSRVVFLPRRTAGGRVSRDQPVSHRWMIDDNNNNYYSIKVNIITILLLKLLLSVYPFCVKYSKNTPKYSILNTNLGAKTTLERKSFSSSHRDTEREKRAARDEIVFITHAYIYSKCYLRLSVGCVRIIIS